MQLDGDDDDDDDDDALLAQAASTACATAASNGAFKIGFSKIEQSAPANSTPPLSIVAARVVVVVGVVVAVVSTQSEKSRSSKNEVKALFSRPTALLQSVSTFNHPSSEHEKGAAPEAPNENKFNAAFKASTLAPHDAGSLMPVGRPGADRH